MTGGSATTQASKIGVVGAGYVGLTTAACLAHLGHRVVCADVDTERVDRLRRGEIPIVEEGLAEIVAATLANGTLTFEVGAARAAVDADVVFLCVPTPQGPDGGADLRYIEGAAAEIADALRPGALVVNKSTVPVGSTRAVEEVLHRPDVAVVSNPEFLREGTAVGDFLHPDRVVIGADDRAAGERLADVYAPLERVGVDHRSGVGGDDQVRGQRVSGDEGLLRQRHRRDVRGGRGQCRRRCRGDRLGPADRAIVPQAGPGLGRQLLPQGLQGARQDRRRLRVRLHDDEGRHRRQRRAASADGRQGSHGPRCRPWGWAARGTRRRPRVDVQGGHRRPA